MKIKNLYFNIYYCNKRRITSNENYLGKKKQILKNHKLILITEGKGSIVINGKEYSLKSGILLYLTPGINVTVKIQDSIGFLSVLFDYARVNFNEGKWEICSTADLLSTKPILEIQDCYPIEEIFKKLTDCWNAKLPGYEFITKTFLQQLLIAIAVSHQKQQPNYANSLKVERVINHMHQNINNKITLTELSDIIGLSSFYLSKIFKEVTGYSVIEYFNQIKIDQAKELLLEGDKKVKEVAKILGFSDEFYFSRIFKKMEGSSPSEFYNKNVHGI
jgi:AraC family transcriptional regulator, transcriptional activator for feuABC-ybbA operon